MKREREDGKKREEREGRKNGRKGGGRLWEETEEGGKINGDEKDG